MARYGLIGEHLSHSHSPYIHKQLAGDEYELIELDPAHLGEFLSSGKFDGLNVTIPFKEAVIPYLDELSDTASAIGAVNTIYKKADGSLVGDNTDAYGFAALLSTKGVEVKDKNILVLGSGGASKAVTYALETLGAREVVVVSRTGENNYNNIGRNRNAQVIINTTPLGMYPNNGEQPLTLENFKKLEAVVDVIYNPLKTALIMEAELRGIKAVSGLMMLVYQAGVSSGLFHQTTYEAAFVKEIGDKLESSLANVALIGMPGSGKSTVGKRLAAMTGRDLISTDALVEKISGRTCSDIITTDGETAFRLLETRVLSEVGKEQGLVIDCGGGVVTQPRNMALLKQNSFIVFLDAPIEQLETTNRPLSQTRGLIELAKERVAAYYAWADTTVKPEGVLATAMTIKEILQSRSEGV